MICARIPLLTFFCVAASAGELVLPSLALERDAPVTAIYRLGMPATGHGTLAIQWTDSYGRIVEERALLVKLVDDSEISFSIDLRRAVAMQNRLDVQFTLSGTAKSGKPDQRRETATASFIAKPPDRQWWDYQIIMWQRHTPEMFAALQDIGISAGQYTGRATTPPDFLLTNNLRWYAENIATDFYAEYHRHRSDRAKNWSFVEAKQVYKTDPSGREAFKRHPSLSDPAWLRRIRDRLAASARFHSQYRPLFYSLADEAGIADLAAYWDFDFSDHSLAAMRQWLKTRYATLGALNEQWGTAFESWDRVIPETTNEAMKRTDGNYSSWSDHKEWMDVAFARALKMGTDAVNSVDPDALVGILGAQMPGWGGYDYSRIVESVSALEPYDIGNNVEIIRSLNPRVAMATTSFATGPWEKHRVWYELLHGSRGLILWDDKSEYVTKGSLAIGERGQEARSYYNELRSGIGALLINSTRQSDPIAIHYSQPSMRIEWMLAQKDKGDAWVGRSSATERKDSEFLRIRESWCRLVEDLGMQYNFVSYGQLEEGELLRGGYRALVLPHSTALSEKEVAAINAFRAQGGLVLSDGKPGVYDEHSRIRKEPVLQDLQPLKLDVLNYHQNRLVGKEGPVRQAMYDTLSRAGVQPEFHITDASGMPPVGVELHRFRNGGVTILGLHTNPQLRVDELGPPEFKSNERFEKPQSIKLILPSEMYAFDVRGAKTLGKVRSVDLRVDPYEPSLIALSPAPLPTVHVPAPASVSRGETVAVRLRLSSSSPADKHIYRIETAGPDGKILRQYSGNVMTKGESASHRVPLAMNDVQGRWTVRTTDVLSGQTQSVSFDVQ